MSVPAYPTEAVKVKPMTIEIPVEKTFIQYPARRNPSLDAFFQERRVLSCPASRMNSIEEDETDTEAPFVPMDAFNDCIAKLNPTNMEYTVKNTFIDFPAWESLRNPSLEGFFKERGLQSCPASRAQSMEDSLETSAFAEAAEDRVMHMENQAMRSISLEECLRDIEDKYQNLESYDDAISTKANTDDDISSPTPCLLSDAEENAEPQTISLSSSLGLWSIGSANHCLGTCKPCAFLWRDANGCENGENCSFCHLCPPGEVKQRKKQKHAMRKMVRQFRRAQMAGY